MHYDAITIDTNIFDRNRLHLEGGLLGQLTQFKQGNAKFIISEIVVRELRAHLIKEAKDAKAEFDSALKKAERNGLYSADVFEKINQISENGANADSVARQRLKSFIEATGAEIIRADQTDIKALIKLYFSTSAPFEGSGNKKCEFPDAIALLSLEEWAKANGKKILAISNDLGWSNFANSSEHIDVKNDFPAALRMLQEHGEQAEKVVALLLEEIATSKKLEFVKQISAVLDEETSETEVYAEASSAYHFEEDQVVLTFQYFEFRRPFDPYDFNVVQIGKNKIVANASILVKAKAECDFSFSIYDSIDREYIPVGNTSVATEFEFDADLLLTFEGNFSNNLENILLSKIEMIKTVQYVDFGDIGIDHEEQY